MSEDPFDITKESDERIAEGLEDFTAEQLRRVKERSRWVCVSCGQPMDYDYMEGGKPGASPFDGKGCSGCGHNQAVKVQETTSDD